MKKIFLTVIAVILVLFICIGCAPATNNNEDTSGNADTTPTTNPPEPSGTPAEESLINGVDLAKFAIVYSDEDHDYSKRAAEYIKAEILARTEIDLPLVEDSSETTAEYEIVVGETARDISTRLNAFTENTQFAILAEDKQIALEADYFIIAAAAYFFVETYVPEDNFSADIPKEVSIHEPIVEEANNFIVLIGDGMGLYQTLLFDVLKNRTTYSDGESMFYGYYFPSFGFARTNSLSGTTDSAASGTALACGRKTINAYIGQDRAHREIQSITELAASLGKSTAVMSTEASTGATPASFSAHANDRNDSSDILGDQKALTNKYGTIIECNYNYYTAQQITMIENKVTTTLDKLDDNEKGFFLMYEEAHIDKHCHNNDLANTLAALVRFNQVIARFMEYAFYNPDTFVLITADHETGALLPNSSGTYSYGSGNHSSHNVPVFAYGYNSELFNRIVIENIQIPQTIASFMGVNDFGDQTKYTPLSK